MKYSTTTIFAAAAAALMTIASASSAVVCNQGELGSPGQSEVCRLNTPETGKDTSLPCVEIIFRDNTCHFDATEPNYSKAHDECQCNGSTFGAWVECQKCLLDHGFHKEDNIYWSKILSAASEALCTGAPTPSVVSSLSTPAQAGTVVPTLITPINSDGSNQSPMETNKGLNNTAAATQVPWAVNQTSVAITGAVVPQKTCAEKFSKQQNISVTVLPTDLPVTIIPIPPTDSLTSADSSTSIATTSDASLLVPGIHSSSESSDATSSFGKSGLAVAIAGGILMGVL
ncbi:hypothetical protein ACHAQJ_006500 [Trichoderma viride]